MCPSHAGSCKLHHRCRHRSFAAAAAAAAAAQGLGDTHSEGYFGFSRGPLQQVRKEESTAAAAQAAGAAAAA